MKNNLKKTHYVVLIILLCISFYKTYSIHLDYPFPYHHDEWQHLGISMQAIDKGFNAKYNPFLGEEHYHFDLESGFHLFLSSIFILSGLDPILNYQFLAALFSVISGLAIFFCTYKLSKKFEIGLLSLMIFISLKSNVNILGKVYFVPLSMVIPFMFIFIYYFINSLQNKDFNEFIFSIILSGFVLLIHPPSFIILIIPMLIEVFYNLDFIKTHKKKLLITILILIVLFLILSFIFLWKGKPGSTTEYLLDLLVFEKGWGKIEITYFIPLLFGILSTLFAIYGFIKGHNTRLRFFIYLSVFSLGLTAFFNHFGFSVIIPYQRAVHYSMLGLMPLTALGLYSLVKKFSKEISIVIYIVFFALILSSQYDLDLQYKEYDFSPLSENDYLALTWLKDNYGTNNTVITHYFTTSTVYPVSSNKVISLIPSQMGGGLTEDNQNFFTYDCDVQLRIINNSNTDFILSGKVLDCDFLEQVYYNYMYIYKVI